MFEKLDKIIVTEEDFKKIFDWNVKNRSKFDSLDVPISEGLVKYTQQVEDTSYTQFIYFCLNDKAIIKAYDGNDMKEMLSFEMNESNEMFSNIKSYLKAPKEVIEESAKSCFLILFDILQYISNAPQFVKEVKEVRNVVKKQKSKKSSKNNKTRQVKISTTRYTFDYSEEHAKRMYERSAELWSVRGHWRYYKSTGKRVWIKPHVKGTGENIEAKEYRI